MDVNQDEFGLPQPAQEPSLPPAGYQREEELAIRKDQLEQQIDERSEQTFAVNPQAFEPDREIRHDLYEGHLQPSKADPNYEYAWVQCRHPEDNPYYMVERKKSERVRVGNEWIHPWEVVTGSGYKEAKKLTKANGERRIGDVLLMRCRKDYYVAMELEKRKLSHQRNFGLDSELVDVALRAGTEAGAATYNKYKSDANQSIFGNSLQMQLDKAMRTGTLPGLEINRR